MSSPEFRLDYPGCRAELGRRLEAAKGAGPSRVQLLTGPRQVGKTTLLLELAESLGPRALYAACDGPAAALPGFWERLWVEAGRTAEGGGRAVVLLDEVERIPDWASRLKAVWDDLKRRRAKIDIVATGSSALRLAGGSKESLAGRFERLTISHWSARSTIAAFAVSEQEAVDLLVARGAYPGAFEFREDPARHAAYLRDAIVEPAVGRDILALAQVRRPALLRQVFALACSSPATIVSLQKLQGQLQDRGALETIAQYLSLLEEAYLVAALPKFASNEVRRRNAPPKLVALSNAFLGVVDPLGPPDPKGDPSRYGRWVENACLAHAWNQGQTVAYWREEPLEVDAVVDGSWGAFAIEVKTGHVGATDLAGLLEFARRHPRFTPLVLCEEATVPSTRAYGVAAMSWRSFLLDGPTTTSVPGRT
jgi:predicted AAA+ superfamily ATPase